MKIRTVIVDDEALARSRTRKLLAQEPEVEVAGECANGAEAIAFIEEHRPDLVFLDVQMPEVSGFDVLRALSREIWPAIIFLTAHDEHALEAFGVHALDYLLKPCTRERLHEAVQRVARHLQTRDLPALNERLAELLKSQPAGTVLNRIAVKTDDRTIFVKVDNLDYVESAGNYIVLHTAAGNHVLRETITNLESKLPPKSFVRISRSVIVNADRIKELQPGIQGDYVVVLQNNTQLSMTRGLREVQDRLQYL